MMPTPTNPLMTALSTLRLTAAPAHAAAPYMATVATGPGQRHAISLPPEGRLLVDMGKIDRSRAVFHLIAPSKYVPQLTRFADRVDAALRNAAGIGPSFTEVGNLSQTEACVSVHLPRAWVVDPLHGALEAFGKDGPDRNEFDGPSYFSQTIHSQDFAAFFQAVCLALGITFPKALVESASPAITGDSKEGSRAVGDAVVHADFLAPTHPDAMSAGNNQGDAWSSPVGVTLYP